jgi:hypothetical protein
MNSLLRVIAIVVLFPIASSFGQPAAPQMDCNDENMSKASAEMDKLPGGEKKTTAMKELAMAREMMAKKDMIECKTHLNNALKVEISK